MEYVNGPTTEWDPLDESPESYQIGDLLFGEQQQKIREIARKMGKPARGSLRVSQIDHQKKTITFTRVED